MAFHYYPELHQEDHQGGLRVLTIILSPSLGGKSDVMLCYYVGRYHEAELMAFHYTRNYTKKITKVGVLIIT
jgi:hypothetical protein